MTEYPLVPKKRSFKDVRPLNVNSSLKENESRQFFIPPWLAEVRKKIGLYIYVYPIYNDKFDV